MSGPGGGNGRHRHQCIHSVISSTASDDLSKPTWTAPNSECGGLDSRHDRSSGHARQRHPHSPVVWLPVITPADPVHADHIHHHRCRHPQNINSKGRPVRSIQCCRCRGWLLSISWSVGRTRAVDTVLDDDWTVDVQCHGHHGDTFTITENQ